MSDLELSSSMHTWLFKSKLAVIMWDYEPNILTTIVVAIVGNFHQGYQFCQPLHKLRPWDKTNLAQTWIVWYHLFSCHPDSCFPGMREGALLCFQYLLLNSVLSSLLLVQFFHVVLERVGRIPGPFRLDVGPSTVIRFEIWMLLITMLKN